MSSLPGYTLEEFVAWIYDLIVDGDGSANTSLAMVEALGTDTWRVSVNTEQFARIIELHEPYRKRIEDLLENFDEEEQSWRGYAGSVFNFIPEDIGDMAMKICKGPEVQKEIEVVAERPWYHPDNEFVSMSEILTKGDCPTGTMVRAPDQLSARLRLETPTFVNITGRNNSEADWRRLHSHVGAGYELAETIVSGNIVEFQSAIEELFKKIMSVVDDLEKEAMHKGALSKLSNLTITHDRNAYTTEIKLDPNEEVPDGTL